jgi:G:T/U-mismatch repair DNA glycosylase
MIKRMFLHRHPYAPFLFKGVTKLIVGTLPPPRFTTGDLKPGDVNFCYGSRDGQLWPILDKIFDLGLHYENSDLAVRQRTDFLKERGIGICDIVESAMRSKIDASDLGMQEVKLRNLLTYLHRYTKVDTLLFTGGNSKNGPEYFFRKLLKERDVAMRVISGNVPRIHEFVLPAGKRSEATHSFAHQVGDGLRTIKTVSLIAPSGAANRAVGSLLAYKEKKDSDPNFTTFDFRVLQYKAHF